MCSKCNSCIRILCRGASKCSLRQTSTNILLWCLCRSHMFCHFPVAQVLPLPLSLLGGLPTPIAVSAPQRVEQIGLAPALNFNIAWNSGPIDLAKHQEDSVSIVDSGGHFCTFCPNNPVPTPQSLATLSEAKPDRVHQVSGTKELWDIYVPNHLFNR